MHTRRNILVLGLASGLTACGQSKFVSYDGPDVTQVFVSKSRRRMYLLNGEDVLKAYDIELGYAPEGHKQQSGDGKTPEGFYWIDRRNPNSAYHLSLGISYPNSRDRAAARAQGVDPGGDIFIHGENTRGPNGQDWTAGCIAVRDSEMEEIYAMVRDHTPIYIAP